MMRLLRFSLIIIALTIVNACSTTKIETYRELEAKKDTATGIDFFHGSFQEAKILAKKHRTGFLKRQKERLIFIDAYAAWCGPCKIMSAHVFTKPEVGDYFDKHFINMKVDCEKGDGVALARQLGVSVYPTLFILDPKGNVVDFHKGGMQPEQLIQWAKDVRSSYYSKDKKKKE